MDTKEGDNNKSQAAPSLPAITGQVEDAAQQLPDEALMIAKSKEARQFLLARGRAIEAYALYEQSMGRVYASLIGIAMDYAGVTFFRINNARSRRSIIGRLLKKRHGAEYNVWWNSLEKKLRVFDDTRNKIVHWLGVEEISIQPNGNASRVITLRTPNIMDSFGSESPEKFFVNDLYEFIREAEFFANMFNMFFMVVSGEMAQFRSLPDVDKSLSTWQQIFQQAVIYPPPSNHPLYRTR